MSDYSQSYHFVLIHGYIINNINIILPWADLRVINDNQFTGISMKYELWSINKRTSSSPSSPALWRHIMTSPLSGSDHDVIMMLVSMTSWRGCWWRIGWRWFPVVKVLGWLGVVLVLINNPQWSRILLSAQGELQADQDRGGIRSVSCLSRGLWLHPAALDSSGILEFWKLKVWFKPLWFV